MSKFDKPKGTYTKEQFKRLFKSEEQKEKKKLRKLREMQLRCNHIDGKSGKIKLKHVDNDGSMRKCKICKAEINVNPDVLNASTIGDAVEIMYSAISVIRSQIPVKPKLDAKFVSAMEVIDSVPGIFREMQEDIENRHKKNKNKKKDKHKGDGNKKKKNKKNKGFKRVSY